MNDYQRRKRIKALYNTGVRCIDYLSSYNGPGRDTLCFRALAKSFNKGIEVSPEECDDRNDAENEIYTTI